MRGKAILLAVLLVVSMVATAAMPAAAAAAEPEATGEVSISASPASSGQQFDYIINDEASVDQFNVSLTGKLNDEQVTVSETKTGDGSIKFHPGDKLSGDGSLDYSISYQDNLTFTGVNNEVLDIRDAYGSIKRIEVTGTDSTTRYAKFELPDGSETEKHAVNNGETKIFTKNLPISVSDDYNLSQVSNNGNFDVKIVYGDDYGTIKINGETEPSEGSISIPLSAGTNKTVTWQTNGTISATGSWYESTIKTRDPNVTINGNTVGISGVLEPGVTRSLSVSEDWIKSVQNNVSVSMAPTDGPPRVVGLDYTHTAATTINTTTTSTQFESSYNTSHTYRNATANATVLLPFDSDRVVEINNLEYRINGGSWDSLTDAEYTFDGSQITADISAAYGGELPEDSTVDVRSTGRKIDVRNGAVSVTDPTAPGDELDTKLSIDSKSDGFAVNVGPTESGSRVHYGLSDDFGGTGPIGSAVLESNGDQHVQFPTALPGDSVRMKHLRTQVKPQSGDVRIKVQATGSDPKIDVSPGPGGAGDPVDIKYYRTQTGSEYILESLTQGIVLDSDTAESPAIFSDDDSDETWLIALGTVGGDGDTEEGEGIIGPVQQSTGIEIPFSGPVQPLIALLAIGALATVYFRGPDGFAYFSRAGGRAASATRSSIPIVGGLLGRLFGAIGTALSYGFGGLVRLAGFARSRPRLTAGVAGVASMAAVAFGVIPLPIELVFAAGVPLVSFVLLRELGQFNVTVWAATSIAAFLGSLVALGVSFDGLINEQTSLILAVGGLYIAYQVVQTWRQGQITEVVIPGRNGGDDQ